MQPFVTSFLHLVFEVHPPCSLYLFFILFCGWKIWRRRDMPHFTNPFIWVCSTFWWLRIVLLWTFTCKYLSGCLFSILTCTLCRISFLSSWENRACPAFLAGWCECEAWDRREKSHSTATNSQIYMRSLFGIFVWIPDWYQDLKTSQTELFFKKIRVDIQYCLY